MTSLNIFTYADQQVRTVTVDSEPWFFAGDVARILGYRMASDLTRRLDDEEKGTHSTRTPSGNQNVTIVSESGLYAAVLGSKLPEAKQFKKWVTGTVLPSIRKTGSYGSQLPSSFAEALELAAAKVREVEALEAKVATDAPKVDYVDTFVADGDVRLLRNVAKSLGMQESVLRDELIARKWIYQESMTRWSASQGQKVEVHRYSPYSEKRDYFEPVPNHVAPRFKGEVMHTLKVTPAGATAIARNFGVTS